MSNNSLYNNYTSQIINSFYKVYNVLGYGFLEKVYQNSLIFELRKNGFQCEKSYPIEVYYQENKVGFYIADILVENIIVVEVKAAETMCLEHELQLINYLKATNIEVGLLLNFGKRPELKRKVFTTEYKKLLPKV
jgi:GxxExxY protein